MIAVLLIPLGLALLYFAERWVFARYWNRDLHVRLTFETGARREGEETVLKEVVTNRNFLPLPLLVVGYTLDRGLVPVDRDASISDHTNLQDIFSLRFYERITRRVRFACTKRGYYRIVRTSLTAQDILTGQDCYCNEDQETHLYVYPGLLPDGDLELPLQKLLGDLETRQYLYEDPFTFRGIRDYTPGDPMRAINWKASARTGELAVNIRDYTGNRRVTFLLNLEPPSIVYSDIVLEDSIRIAAGLSGKLLEHGICVGFASNARDILSGEESREMPGLSSEAGRLLLEAFARIDLNSPVSDGEAFLRRAAEGETPTGTLVLISPCVRTEVVSAASYLAAKKGNLLWIVPVMPDTRPPEEIRDPRITMVQVLHRTKR